MLNDRPDLRAARCRGNARRETDNFVQMILLWGKTAWKINKSKGKADLVLVRVVRFGRYGRVSRVAVVEGGEGGCQRGRRVEE